MTSACVKPLATAPVASHSGTPVEVPYPPPPARVDIVKEPPSDVENPVWVDGQFRFNGRRWIWNEGGWKSLPKGFGYAPPRVVRRSDGTLVWFEGMFRRMSTDENVDGDADSP